MGQLKPPPYDQPWQEQEQRAAKALRRELPRRQWQRHQEDCEIEIRSGGRRWYLDTERQMSNCRVTWQNEFGDREWRYLCFGPFDTEQPHDDFILAQYLLIKYMPDFAWDIAEDG